MSRTGNTSADSGFSLLEVIIATTIFAVAATVAVGGFASLSDAISRETVPKRLERFLSDARNLAQRQGRDVDVLVDLGERRLLSIDANAELKIPPTSTLKFIGSEARLTGAQSASILFFADGTSTGGTIIVTTANQMTEVRVSWLSSNIERRDL